MRRSCSRRQIGKGIAQRFIHLILDGEQFHSCGPPSHKNPFGIHRHVEDPALQCPSRPNSIDELGCGTGLSTLPVASCSTHKLSPLSSLHEQFSRDGLWFSVSALSWGRLRGGTWLGKTRALASNPVPRSAHLRFANKQCQNTDCTLLWPTMCPCPFYGKMEIWCRPNGIKESSVTEPMQKRSSLTF